MEATEAVEQAEKAHEAVEAREHFVRRAAVLVGVLAAILAVAAIAGNQAGEEVILNQEKATDTWNEYQADSLKMRMDTQSAAVLTTLATGSTAEAAAKAQAAKWVAEANDHYRPTVADLRKTAEEYQKERDTAAARHKAYQFSEALLQIGIVLATVAIVTRIAALVFIGGGLGVIGLLLLLDGLMLVWRLP